MSDRIYVDPVTHSAREERALFEFGKKLNKSVGQFYRLGIITYCRSLAEGGYLSEELLTEFNLIIQKDSDYLEQLKRENFSKTDICQTNILTQIQKDPQSLIEVWDDSQKSYVNIPD